MNEVSPARHYDLLIDEIDDPAHPTVTDSFYDQGAMRAWMEQADGPVFFQALGDVRGQQVLEIGIGTGRVAKKVLDLGCAYLTGIDVSSKTLARARHNLAAYDNLELVCCAAESFLRKEAFDLAYYVWAFFHIPDQQHALASIVASLRPGGRLVLSLEQVDEWLDYGSRQIRQYPVDPAQVAEWLTALGCRVAPLVEVTDRFGTSQERRLFGTVLVAMKDTAG